MTDLAEIADFLQGYADECADAGVAPLPVPQLAALVRLVAKVDPSELDS